MKKKIGMIAALFCMGCLVAEPVTVIKAAEIQVAAAQTTLSADNSLEVLSLSAGTLSPDFTGKTVQYTATVPNDVTSVTVTATPVNEFATVESITGNDNLQVGTNTIKVVVKAQNGALAQYTITLTREDGQAADGAAEQPADGTADQPADGTDGQNTDQPADTADGQNTDQPADAADGQVTDQPVDGTTDQSAEADAGDDEDTSNMEYLQQQYNDLSEQYTKEKSFSRNMMGIMAFVIAVLVVIIVNLLLRGRRTDDWDEEDDDDWESAEKRRNVESEDIAGMEEDDHVIEENPDVIEEDLEEEEDIEPEQKGFFHRKSRDAEKTEETEEDETENEIGVTKIHKVHAGLFGQGMSDDLDDEDWDDEEEFSPVEKKMPKEKPEEEQRPEKKQRPEEKQKPEKKQRPEEKQRPERKYAPEKKHIPREEEEDDDLEIIDLNDL